MRIIVFFNLGLTLPDALITTRLLPSHPLQTRNYVLFLEIYFVTLNPLLNTKVEHGALKSGFLYGKAALLLMLSF